MRQVLGEADVSCSAYLTMKKILLFTSLLLISVCVKAQDSLPRITVKNYGGKIVVSWKNPYRTPVTNIFIQRSFDSLKNFTSIGTVLNPQSKENGYSDPNPPYSKMYYRVSVSFEDGSYIISQVRRPVKDSNSLAATESARDERFPWMAVPVPDSIQTEKKTDEITYPSQHIFTGRDNNVVIQLKDARQKKYIVRFYDESNEFLFELNKLTEEFLILEKVNFSHSGWFFFELFEDGVLKEKNKFQLIRDVKGLNR